MAERLSKCKSCEREQWDYDTTYECCVCHKPVCISCMKVIRFDVSLRAWIPSSSVVFCEEHYNWIYTEIESLLGISQ